jgi:hypothetical protein
LAAISAEEKLETTFYPQDNSSTNSATFEVDHTLNKAKKATRPLFTLPPEKQPRPHGESEVYLIGNTTQGEALVKEFERWVAYYQVFNASILEVATAGAADGGGQQTAMFDLFTHAEEMAARPDPIEDIPAAVLAHFWVEPELRLEQERAARLTLYACAMQAYARGVSRFKHLLELEPLIGEHLIEKRDE